MPSNKRLEDLKVFISNRDSRCDACNEALGRHAWIRLEGDGRAICLACADLDHLVFLPSGDAALTRRTRKHSRLSAVVLKWSRARQRYERQGLLVEDKALTQAELECAADAKTRAARREQAAERRAELDQAYIERFASRARELYPGCPEGREQEIAEHACRKYSGRVGRSAAAKALDDDALRLAVMAHIRHAETPYDDLLVRGVERGEARERVSNQAAAVLEEWQRGAGPSTPSTTDP
ncbi:DUF2293 domain-containing protein [Thiorhodococcus minor]|nr:DUF2293 domain-containing protein [Thiorhodococcus minor]